MNKNIQTRPFSNSFRQPVPLRLAADDGGDDDALTDGISPASISSERSRLEASFCGKGEDGDSSPRSEFCDSGEESDASIARELLTLLQDMKRRKKSDPESKQMYGMLKSKLLDSPKALGEFLSRSRVEGFDVGGLDLGMELLPKEPDTSLTPSDVVQTVVDSLRGNDKSKDDEGIKTLFSFTSPASSLSGTSVEDFRKYLPNSKYAILLEWGERVWDRKMEVSADKGKAYVACRLKKIDDGNETNDSPWHHVSFVLSSRKRPVPGYTDKSEEVWLIDSMLVREKN